MLQVNISTEHIKRCALLPTLIFILISTILFTYMWYYEFNQSVCIYTTLCKAIYSMNESVYIKNDTFLFVVDSNKSNFNRTRNRQTSSSEFTSENNSTSTLFKQNITDTFEGLQEKLVNVTNSSLSSISNRPSKTITKVFSAVPEEMEPLPGEKHIVFIETRCILQEVKAPRPGLSLTKRQACVVESAAKMNPDYNVYLIYTCRINGELEDTSTHERAMFLYPNIKLWKLNITKHLAGTPLANWDFMKAISSSHWPHEHASDVLRYVTLWKYGGIYMDLDVIVLKSLDELGWNYVGVESEQTIGSCVLSFASDGLGHEVAEKCVQEILHNFRGDIWIHNGPGLISRVLLKMCNINTIPELSTERCRGFKILSDKEFFPISYPNWELFFSEYKSEIVMHTIQNSYGVHMWNLLSKQRNITIGSKEPYNLMAEKACPWVHSMFGDYF